MRKLEINRKMLIAVIALSGLSIGLMAQPRESNPRFEPGNHQKNDMLVLSEEQKAEIKQIHLDMAKEIQPLKDEMKINKARINALIHKDNPDMKEIVSLVEANGRILTQVQVKEIESRIRIRALLTNDQKVIFDAREGRMQRHREMAVNIPQRQLPEKRRF
jgi:Spy/CpxP family protein refolding chaperone